MTGPTGLTAVADNLDQKVQVECVLRLPLGIQRSGKPGFVFPFKGDEWLTLKRSGFGFGLTTVPRTLCADKSSADDRHELSPLNPNLTLFLGPPVAGFALPLSA